MFRPIAFETVDAYLSEAAQEIHDCRKEWIVKFTPIFMRYYNIIGDNNETVRLDYRSELNEKPMGRLLSDNFQKDRLLGFTSQGVHRDDIELMLGNELMRKSVRKGSARPTLSLCVLPSSTS